MKSLFLIILLLTGCADYMPAEFKVDPRLETYVESFYEEAHARGVYPDRHVEIRIGQTSTEYSMGTSSTRGLRKTVTIADWHWHNMLREHGDTPEMFDAGMENLIFHEMGHAVLHRKHCDPCYSVMNSEMSVFEYAWEDELRSKLIDELFNHTQ